MMKDVMWYDKRLRGVLMHKLASDYLTWSNNRYWAEVAQYQAQSDRRELVAHQEWWERGPDEPEKPLPVWYPRRTGQLYEAWDMDQHRKFWMELDQGMIDSAMWYGNAVLNLAQLPPSAAVADPHWSLTQSFLEHEKVAKGANWICRPDAYAVHEKGNRLQLFEYKTMEIEPRPGSAAFAQIEDKLRSCVPIVSDDIQIGFESADGYLLWNHDGTRSSIWKMKLR